MNYIKYLESENKNNAARICAFAATIQDIQEYLLSDKFFTDPTVQTQDILTRLQQGLDHYNILLEVRP